MSDIEKTNNENDFPLGRKNFIYLAIGFAVIILGFILMAGGKNPDPTTFKPEEIFSVRRIIIAPTMVLAGFVFEIFAIMKKTD